jgi:hypothetical protein
VQDNPPTEPPSGEPVPTPTPTPAIAQNERPSLSVLTASERKISYDTGDFCPNAPTSAVFRVRATDDEGVQSVALFWRKPGTGAFARAPMSRTAGGERNGTWQTTLDTGRNSITQAGSLAYYAVATDTDGATRRLPGNGSSAIQVERCTNEGPAITAVRSSGGSPLFEDPFGVSRCQTATNITASVKDPQGVDSVRLYYRRPTDDGFLNKPMTLRNGRWFANLDTLGDKITIANPPTGLLRWYIQATDDEGETSKIDTRLVTIRRCDSEANFDGVEVQGKTYPCTPSATMTIYTYSDDNDQPNQKLKVVFHWKLSNPRTGDGPISGQMTANVRDGVYYAGTTRPFNGQKFYAGFVEMWAVTTDRFGGTTTSPHYSQPMACQ